jgi:16S rRNA processing protein RimM
LTHPRGEPADRAARAAAADRRLTVGRVGRAHGLDGSFYVTRPISRLLRVGTAVAVGPAPPVEIVRRAGTDERPIVRVAGVEDRARAEALLGLALTLSSEHAPALEPGEWWAHELVGCEVGDGPQLLGTVSRLLELPSCEALEVSPPGGAGRAVIVPMVKDAIVRVDTERRRIDVDLEFLDLRPAEEGRP